MPTVLLTDIRVRQLKPSDVQVTYWDTQLRGFGVRVGRQRKTWLVMRGKKRTRVTLGHYPQLGLSEARKKAMAAFGETPTTIANRMNFETALEKFVTQHCVPNYRPRSRYQVERTLRRYFLPLFAKTALHKIADRDIGDVLEKMSKTPSEANHAFAHVRTFFRWCARPPRRYVQHSPCEGMEMPYRTTARKRVLTDVELVAVWRAADVVGYPFGTILKLLILTGQRWGEIASLRWEYINTKERTIRLPETKNGRTHTFPYGASAAAIIASIPRRNSTMLLFPGRKDELPWNGSGKSKWLMKKACPIADWTIHDLRRTASTNWAALGAPPHVVERLLNHTFGSLQAHGALSAVAEVYNRYQYLPEMRQAIHAWEKRLTSILRSNRNGGGPRQTIPKNTVEEAALVS